MVSIVFVAALLIGLMIHAINSDLSRSTLGWVTVLYICLTTPNGSAGSEQRPDEFSAG